MFRSIVNHWKRALVFQLILMLLIALCATYLPLLFTGAALPLRVLFVWLLPLTAGAGSACLLARAGLNAYLCWLLPPVIHSAVPWLLIGFPPSPASMLVCALVSLIGAAAGDVLRSRFVR